MKGAIWSADRRAIRKRDDLIPNSHDGFTLIELIVVISLIALILFAAIPRFQDTVLSDNTKKTSRWIIAKAETLKQSAVHDQKLYVLHISPDSGRLWITNPAMSENELENATQNAFKLPSDVKVLDVEYPDDKKIEVGWADINFYEKGYSDMAIIHIENSANEQLSFVIEPFLPHIRIYQKYVRFGE